ncbi:hypothetical protein M405DRAFT_74591 [Rhizopogon salebrosus TDB-379]|nr:hypothetical protein M405DRAFT_74591 [Rhizopogon salebrosus TDB-379]
MYRSAQQSSNYSNVSTGNLPSVKKGSWSVLKDEPVSAADAYALGLLLHTIFNPTQRANSLKPHTDIYAVSVCLGYLQQAGGHRTSISGSRIPSMGLCLANLIPGVRSAISSPICPANAHSGPV